LSGIGVNYPWIVQESAKMGGLLLFSMPLALIAGFVLHSSALQESPVLKTRWTSSVSQSLPHNEYPRPQMARTKWVNLNGKWDLAIAPPASETVVADRHREILVPFPPESVLSGVNEMVPSGMALYYSREFAKPAAKASDRVLLHFGASDWDTEVRINGSVVGTHRGGYDPFTFDITHAIDAKKLDKQQIVVKVVDPTDKGTQPRGKQVVDPGGIFYRPTSGIWQTVWMEVVPKTYIQKLKTWTSNKGKVTIQVSTETNGAKMPDVWAELYDGKTLVSRGLISAKMAQPLTTIELDVPSPKLWSPEHPHLYTIKVGLKAPGVQDTVNSYVGIREVKLGKDKRGRPALLLNGKPTFMFGPLDQGFWPDGLYTAPTDDALKFDIVETKKMGFNMIRKHVKVEPSRWYYWCDKVGILVWQYMPSGDRSIGPSDPDMVRTPESEKIFRTEWKAIIDSLYNHPSVVTWIPFNEGWGQFKTKEIVDWTMKYDRTRLVDGVTGWSDRGVSHMSDVHIYPGPGAPSTRDGRALVLGEFGGLGLPVKDHMWKSDFWGYQSYKSKAELTQAIKQNFFQLRLLRDKVGLAAAVYTQTTDVETEANGLMTYDREVIKPDLAVLKKAIAEVYLPGPKMDDLLPTSEEHPQTWSYTTTEPEADWMAKNYTAAGWKKGEAGFGTNGTPGAIVKTEWDTKDIWLRRTFTIAKAEAAKNLMLRMHHDDDVEVYIDGMPVFKRDGWTSGYTLMNWDGGALAAGEHTIAVHCHQNEGGQYIDVGIVRVSR
jgi:hypothetical protein